jgi:hypothetical protein
MVKLTRLTFLTTPAPQDSKKSNKRFAVSCGAPLPGRTRSVVASAGTPSGAGGGVSQSWNLVAVGVIWSQTSQVPLRLR